MPSLSLQALLHGKRGFGKRGLGKRSSPFVSSQIINKILSVFSAYKLLKARLLLSEGLLRKRRCAVFRNQEFYPAAAFVIWAASICVVIIYYG
jgi:hypothetical protein